MNQLLLGFLLLCAHPGDGPALETALRAVDAGRICADVRFIASDELQGRDSPSQGLELAARYIRARLERLAFEPGGDQGFFDVYRLERSGFDATRCRARLQGPTPSELVFGRDYAFWGGGGEHDLEGGVVYVGSARAEELEGLDLSGRWALVLEGQGAGRRSGGRGSERAARQERLEARGALGLLLGTDPRVEGAEERDGRIAGTARWASQPGLRLPAQAEGRRGLPALTLASGAVRALLGGSTPPAVGSELAAGLREERRMLASETLELENVAGLWRGSDPALANEVIVLSAHYDHEGVRDGQIYNGADDNGSGTCGLLAVAEALAARGPLRRSVLLLWVSAEEKGLLGSQAWAREPTLPPGMRAVCNLNVDMIGRNAPDELHVTPSREHAAYNGLTRLAESLAPLEGFPALLSADEYWERSDHHSFSEHLQIPVAFLFADVHEDYHQPTDDADKIDCDKIRRVARLLVRMLDGLQADELAL